VARKPERGDTSETRSGNQPASDLPDSVRVFAENLLAARKAAKLTQVQLSERSGVSQSHISQLEKGNLEPRLSTILALAGALGVETGALLPPPPPQKIAWVRPPDDRDVTLRNALACAVGAEAASAFDSLWVFGIGDGMMTISAPEQLTDEQVRILSAVCKKAFPGVKEVHVWYENQPGSRPAAPASGAGGPAKRKSGARRSVTKA